ncbi:MAG TPA: alpha/beta hydrolase-fold protein [Candidatus Limnocylindrales bacterium]
MIRLVPRRAARRDTAEPQAGAWPVARLRPPATLRRGAAAVLVAWLVVGAAVAGGWLAGSDATLVIMGFDPDRARLISALLIGAAGTAAATLVADAFLAAALAGAIGAAAVYAGTFWRETADALVATGTNGSFDAGGWLLTLVALVCSALGAGWAAATLARPVRRRLGAALMAVRDAVRERRLGPRRLARPAATVLVVALVAVTVPTIGALLDYAPDSLMLHGGPAQVGLSDGGAPTDLGGLLPSPDASPGPSASSGPTASPDGSPSPSSTPGPRGGAPVSLPLGGPRPWLAWRPSGPGSLVQLALPGPWTGGGSAALTVYLPPGYGTGTRRYPVIYEAPTPYSLWDGATNAKVTLDTLIDQGTIPASIVVFIDSFGGPYPDSECADSADGRQWMDRYVGETVPAYLDAHFRTIAEPAARAIMGMSQGGYCAAILAIHHPSVFGSEISFSGYFQAGIVGGASAVPFGGQQALLAADSPSVAISRLTAGVRRGLDFILVADAAQSFYGPETASFAALLGQLGVPHIVVPAALPHGWSQVRQETPIALQLLARREYALGVFG